LNLKKDEKRRLLPGLKVGEGFTRHPFDEEFGVRTSGLVAGRHLKSGHRHDRHATAYYGVAPSVFRAMVKRWQRSRPGWAMEEVSFIDVGAGMGRAMLLAAELPFRRVVGVELNPTLARIAQEKPDHLARFGAGAGADARHLRRRGRVSAPARALPGISLQSLWRDGDAAAAEESWSKALAARADGLDLIYVNHEQEHVLERQAGFARLFLGKVARSEQMRLPTIASWPTSRTGNMPRPIMKIVPCGAGWDKAGLPLL
jgi:SAM-dependent methyltransferase